MGLILGPIVIVWFLIAIYALKMGYSLMVSYSVVSHSVILILVVLCSLSLYLFISFLGFKDSQELWVFEIATYFILSKQPYLFLVLAIFIQWFLGTYLDNTHLKPLPFIIMFTLSFGGLIGVFSADLFMDKFNITRTH